MIVRFFKSLAILAIVASSFIIVKILNGISMVAKALQPRWIKEEQKKNADLNL